LKLLELDFTEMSTGRLVSRIGKLLPSAAKHSRAMSDDWVISRTWSALDVCNEWSVGATSE
jgi:hypothetical protein